MRILYVTTISNTVNTFLIPHIKMLINSGNQVDVAFNEVQEVKPEIYDMGCKVYRLPFQRSPFSTGNFKAYKKMKNIVKDYDVVHTHTPIASAIVRIACKKISRIKVIYTAHGFHFHKGAPIINWAVYYPIEKWLANYTDVLITINKEDYNRARNKFKVNATYYIPGVGIDINRYIENKNSLENIDLNLPDNSFIILSVGELNKNKNHEIVIRTIAKLNNPRIHYLICGEGELKEKLYELSIDLQLQNNVHLLGYRNDITEIMNESDLFIFPSFREGLSVSLMEAMLLKIPIICSDIRGNRDLIVHGSGGYLFNVKKSEQLEKYIIQIIESDKLIENFQEYNYQRIKEYSLENVIKKLNLIYK